MTDDSLRDLPRADSATNTRSAELPVLVSDHSSEIVRRPVAVPTELVRLLKVLDFE